MVIQARVHGVARNGDVLPVAVHHLGAVMAILEHEGKQESFFALQCPFSGHPVSAHTATSRPGQLLTARDCTR